ncbi:hypothetical protein HGRIS_009223 [Hohenbuehelia grisea]|uniref:Uncharacterized protein n=1 Tax=Hohenbuehelia grisea TaxID=104357 RepID=A0ABR3J0X9_9AGAR
MSNLFNNTARKPQSKNSLAMKFSLKLLLEFEWTSSYLPRFSITCSKGTNDSGLPDLKEETKSQIPDNTHDHTPSSTITLPGTIPDLQFVTPDLDEIKSKMSVEDRRIFKRLMLVPQSPDDLHVRRSARKALIKWVSRTPAFEYISRTCIPFKGCRFQPPRWHYGYKFTYDQALELNQERAPEDERLRPLIHYQTVCRPPIDPVKERSRVAGSWLERRVEKILRYNHEANWHWVWEREEKVQVFSFRDTWAIGDPLAGIQVAKISHLMFGKYVEPMWYLDYDDCYWYEKQQ